MKEPLVFCAIDTDDLDHACVLTREIAPITGGIKLGLEFFNNFGHAGVERIMQAAGDAQIFLDLKFHDIPNTVAGAIRGICRNFSPAYVNVHASGGLAMMQAARQACGKKTCLLAVTILTSLDEAAIARVGYQSGLSERVSQMALLAQEAGMGGVVCSAHEIKDLREKCGQDFVLMVPGIRPEGSAQGDQKRVMTPKQAMQAGVTHLVIGRPITGAENPAKAAQGILESLR